MEIPGLGTFEKDDDLGWHYGPPTTVEVLGAARCRIVLDGYDDDDAPEDFHAAIRRFLALDRSALEAAAPAIYAYYRDVTEQVSDDGRVEIDGPHDVLDHVRPGQEPVVSRDSHGDRHVYVSVECNCDWEPEHGLQIVFRDGATVTKVGPYDGHLTNAAAFADPSLDGVVYHGR
ncbi:hypothetical protein AB0F81_42550 [Actinoplanes sp. NPDC024001]|uniref:DUF6985 domain-containing protein n=1 Tax=Actinoplanes sp. NPDC024001 TaxID=3154598 RepID=UPI0033CBD085